MERIEKRLYDASVEGDLTILQMLIQEDPLILDKVTLNHSDDMPLHIASMLGHIDFVKEILIRKPELSMEYDSQRRLPLHIAAAKGHVEIVKALVSANPETCLACDSDGKYAIHVAAIRGRYEVVKTLMQAQPHSARAMVQHDTILHLCVKNNQLEVLKFFVETMSDHEFLNSRDADGNTILHIAVADKRIETVNFLVRDTTIEVNALSTNGETSIEMLSRGPNDVKDQQIIQSLMHVEALDKKKKEGLIGHLKSKMGFDHTNIKEMPKMDDKYFENKQNSLMIVATVLAAMAFQSGLSPPGGVWQDTTKYEESTKAKAHDAGYAIMFSNNERMYHSFLVANALAFVSTLSIALLLISGLHSRKYPVILRIMTVVMWIATISMLITYAVSIWALSPEPRSKTVRQIVACITGVTALLITYAFWANRSANRNHR